jgi:molecular chaperone Hsp33
LADELHKFLFEGLPVRGMIVRLDTAWVEMLARRNDSEATGPWPAPVAELMGQMAAAGALMQSNIKFNGTLIMQVYGDGPVKVAVAEVQHDLSLRATAKVIGEVGPDARLGDMVNVHGGGRCAITLDPKDRQPGQQPYQGVVPLRGPHGENLQQLSDVLEHYMRQSEQLETRIVLAADEKVAAGLLIQRLPLEGEGNLRAEKGEDEEAALLEHFNRIAILAGSLTRAELLALDVETILRRLFWEEKLLRFDPQTPRFACTCSRERVAGMIRSLGRDEAESILAERPEIDVACDFCGQHYRFDAVDAARIFTSPGDQPPVSSAVQ